MRGIVYKLFNNDKNYFGSTTTTLEERLERHFNHLRYWKNTKKKFCSSYTILEGDYQILILEEGEYDNERELKKREDWFILNNECVNIRRAFLSDEERIEKAKKRVIEYRAKNNGYWKAYYQANKVKYNNQRQEARKKETDKKTPLEGSQNGSPLIVEEVKLPLGLNPFKGA
jgi:hypothetical protein